MTAFGTMRGLRVAVIAPPGSMCIAATGELSLPVPTVVGTAIKGHGLKPIRSG